MDRILNGHHHARDSSKLFRNSEWLRKIPLHFAGTIYCQPVLIRQLIHSKDGYDVLKFLIPLQNLNYPLSGLIMLFSNYIRIQNTG